MNKTHVKTHGKRQGRENKIFKNFAKSNNHCMQHRALNTRNDYERKINYDWPYSAKCLYINHDLLFQHYFYSRLLLFYVHYCLL